MLRSLSSLILAVVGILSLFAGAQCAEIVVAAANSLASAKAKADLVCTGRDDQVTLLKSLTMGPFVRTTDIEGSPSQAYTGFSVEWLAGDYNLTGSLIIPNMQDVTVYAYGTRFRYLANNGDAVVLTGMTRSRFFFGTIFTSSVDAALSVKPGIAQPFMLALMSEVHFTGLRGNAGRGTGLLITKNVCTNFFYGTDINGFTYGVFVSEAAIGPGGKTDTNWFTISYIRRCNICVYEQHKDIDSNQYHVNVDAMLPNSVAIRSNAHASRWVIIMGTLDRSPGTRSIILEKDSYAQVMHISPPLWWGFAPMENHGRRNLIIQAPQTEVAMDSFGSVNLNANANTNSMLSTSSAAFAAMHMHTPSRSPAADVNIVPAEYTSIDQAPSEAPAHANAINSDNNNGNNDNDAMPPTPTRSYAAGEDAWEQRWAQAGDS